MVERVIFLPKNPREEDIWSIILALKDCWYSHPDLRLEQLLQFVSGKKDGFYITDEDWKRLLESKTEWRNR